MSLPQKKNRTEKQMEKKNLCDCIPELTQFGPFQNYLYIESRTTLKSLLNNNKKNPNK